MSPPMTKILTRRLVHSSVAKLIIPARIRHETKNDVLFIGENHVEIKEFFHDGNLENVGILADFDATILSARAYGDVKHPEPPLELSAPDPFMKLEDTGSGDVNHQVSQEVPPQILVLALDSSSLVFLFAHPDPAHALGFVYHERPLIGGESYARKVGKYMAVDPQSRVLAVAAVEGYFSIYQLKPVTHLKEELESQGNIPNQFDPVCHEKHIQVDGIILQMEFLYPPPKATNLVILILILRCKEKTLMQRYEWTRTSDLHSFRLEDTHPLDAAEELPLLLIPFQYTPGFMLIFENFITLRGNVLSGRYSPHREGQILQNEPPEELGSCQQRPRWIQWARPVRRKEWKPEGEFVYLCREDGLIVWLELEGIENIFSLPHNIGRLGINVDTAFASIDNHGLHYNLKGSLSNDDFLVAMGDMSEGGLFRISPRAAAIRQQRILNWAPITDLAVSNRSSPIDESQSPATSTPGIIKSRDQVFAGVGKGFRQGGVCEFRYGIPATSRAISLEDLGSAGITALWVFPDVKTTILVTDPERSYVFELSFDTDDSGGVSGVDLAAKYGLDVGARTVAAGRTENGHIVQITEMSIRISTAEGRAPLIREWEENMVITAASIEGLIPCILIAVRFGDQHFLQLLVVDRLSLKIEVQTPLSSEPSCILLQAVGDQLCAFVGSLDGFIRVFQTNGTQLSLSSEHRFDGEFAICDSIGLISKTADEANNLVLCGLRNGSLQILQLEHINGSAKYVFNHMETLNIGDTSVTVRPDVTSITADKSRCSRATLVCKETLCRLEYRPNQRHANSAWINSIWLINDEPGFQHGALNAVAQVDAWQLGDPASRYLFCVERHTLHITLPESFTNPRVLPRRWNIGGTPNRLIYSKKFEQLLVGYTEAVVTENFRDNDSDVLTGKRRLYPMLGVVDPHEGVINSNAIGHSGERILGMLDWFPDDGQTSRNFLVINTLRQNQRPKKDDGRIFLYRMMRDNEGKVKCEQEHIMDCPGPVLALAPYGGSSIVYCTGDLLKLHKLVMTNSPGKWEKSAECILRSRVCSMSTQEPYIYLVSQDRSLQILRVEGDKIAPFATDQEARNGLHHLLIREHSLIVVSDTLQGVTGMRHSASSRLDNSTAIIFKARLPASIARFHRGPIQPPWYARLSENPKAIIGCGLDGSFFQFEMIDDAQWELLRFIQNMAEGNQILSPFTFARRRRRRIDPSRLTNSTTQINGDVLLRLLDRGRPDPETLLQAMIDEDPVSSYGSAEFGTPAEQMERFIEVLEDALGPLDGKDPIEATVDFLRRILQSVL